jgi:peroxiredoxin
MNDQQTELPHEAAMGESDDVGHREPIPAGDGPAGEGMTHRLQSHREWLRQQWPDYADIYARFVGHLVANGAGRGSPIVGERFPEFILPSHRGHLVRSDHLLRDGPLIVSFNRGHWCGFCQIELTGLKDAMGRFSERRASVVSIIPEPEVRARQLRESLDLGFDVLSDMDLGLATQLDLTVYLGEELRSLLLADDLDIGAYQRTDGWFLPIPATFVVGQDQRVLARYIDADFRNRMDVEAIVAALG